MSKTLSELVWKRAGSVCEYCRVPQEFDEIGFEIEHIISKKHGGQTTASNLCLACFTCNRHKGSDIAGRDSKTRLIVPLFHPRRMKWERHFAWKGAQLLGRSSIGRVTIKVLGINLAHRIELRTELIAEGFFPTQNTR